MRLNVSAKVTIFIDNSNYLSSEKSSLDIKKAGDCLGNAPAFID